MSFLSNKRKSLQSKEVAVGNLLIGGDHPVIIQSMTTTQTMNVTATVEQIIRLADAGCDMVRITAQNIKEALQLDTIKNALVKKGYDLPLVADVHFNPKVAEVAAQIVEKVRINPGNYVDRNNLKIDYTASEYQVELEKIRQKLLPLLDICKKNNTAIRIGTNHGSLSNRILAKYGNTAAGMVESAIEFVEICRNHQFENLVLSIKSSDVRLMIESNKLLVARMIENGYYYPLHLGVTEAGDGNEGRIKAATGIGNLLLNGIGDTIRVSLTEKPENEIPVARQLVELYGKRKSDLPTIKAEKIMLKRSVKFLNTDKLKPPFVVSQGTSKLSDFYLDKNNNLNNDKREVIATETVPVSFKPDRKNKTSIIKLSYSDISKEVLQLRAAAEFSYTYDLLKANGICIHNNTTSADENAQLSFDILQAMGLRFSKAEFIACPSCGRTYFNIQDHLKMVREKTSHLKGIKIAVMGCVVNGPGEMADADYGYVGSGIGKVSLYKGSEIIYQNIEEKLAVDTLISMIKTHGDWKY
jgi:(E)-4-hydroxy-3-methylbut-2-enyl-diphosphate synthase